MTVDTLLIFFCNYLWKQKWWKTAWYCGM